MVSCDKQFGNSSKSSTEFPCDPGILLLDARLKVKAGTQAEVCTDEGADTPTHHKGLNRQNVGLTGHGGQECKFHLTLTESKVLDVKD